MFCPSCGQQNETGANYCSQCGNQLPKIINVETTAAKLSAQNIVSVEFYASFWKRLAALILDFLVLIPGYFIVLMMYAKTMGIQISLSEALKLTYPTAAFIGAFLSWLYYAILESSEKRGTIGKIVLGIEVVDLQGNRISFARATGRYLGKLVSLSTFYVGYIMCAFTKRKQTLHDMMASCLVVNKGATPSEIQQTASDSSTSLGYFVVLGLIPIVGILAAVAIPSYNNAGSQDSGAAYLAGEAAYPRLPKGLLQSVIEQDNGFRLGGTDPTTAAIATAAHLDDYFAKHKGGTRAGILDWYRTVGLQSTSAEDYFVQVCERRDRICTANGNCQGFMMTRAN